MNNREFNNIALYVMEYTCIALAGISNYTSIMTFADRDIVFLI